MSGTIKGGGSAPDNDGKGGAVPVEEMDGSVVEAPVEVPVEVPVVSEGRFVEVPVAEAPVVVPEDAAEVPDEAAVVDVPAEV